MPGDKKAPPWGVGHYWMDRTGRFIGDASASLNGLPSLRVDWSRQRDEPGPSLSKRLSLGLDYDRHFDEPDGEPRAEIWRLGSLSIEQTKHWGCAAPSALYLLMATVAIVTPLILLSQPLGNPQEAQHFIAKLMGMVNAKNAATNARFDACGRLCR